MVALVPLVIKLRCVPWLLHVVVVGAVFITAVAVVSVCTIPLTTVAYDDDHVVNDLVSRYNAYSGFVMSVVDEPLLLAVKAFVPVWIALVLPQMAATRDNGDASVAWRLRAWNIGCVLCSVGLAAAVTNAVASLNVQQLRTSVDAFMGDSDAVLATPATPAANSSSNTIFKALIAPQRNLPDSLCTRDGAFPEASFQQNMYDVRYQPFFQDLVPNAVVPDRRCSFSTKILDAVTRETNDQQMPFTNSTANQLLALAARLYGYVNFSQAQQLVKNDDDIHLNNFVSLVLKNKMEDDTTLVHDQANITFSQTKLATGIVFDAVTLDLKHTPTFTSNGIRRYWKQITTGGNDGDLEVKAPTDSTCGPASCFLHDIQSNVLAYRLCNFTKALKGERDGCNIDENRRIILYSNAAKARAKKIVVEKSNTTTNSVGDDSHVVISGLQLISSITVGILQWQVHDLAEMYQVPCEDGAGACRGIAYNVSHATNDSTVSRVIVASPDGIHSTDLPPVLDAQTIFLAKVYGNIVLKPSDIEDSSGWKNLQGNECYATTDRYMATVISNHLYSEDSFQAAYTGGMYFLFQNGRAIESLPSLSAQRQVFAFAGNKRSVELRASVPLSSAVVSIVGVVTLVVLTILLSCSAQALRDGAAQDTNAAEVIEVLVNHERFPKSLLHCKFGHPDSSQELVEFEAASLRLKGIKQNEVVTLDEYHGVGHEDPELIVMTKSELSDLSLSESGWRDHIPVIIQLHRMRLIVASVALAVIYVVLLILLVGDGMLLMTVPDDADNIRRKVQDYSFYSGTLGAMLTAPAERLVCTLVPVLSLKLASSPAITRTLMLMSKLVAIWSLTTAINSVNVQSGAGHVESRMKSADVAVAPQLNDHREYAHGSANNTILRSFINGVMPPTIDLKCTRANMRTVMWNVDRDGPIFSITPRLWHKAFLSHEITAIASTTFNTSSDMINKTDLPVNPRIATALLVSNHRRDPTYDGLQPDQHFQDKHRPNKTKNYQIRLSRYQLTTDIDFHVVTEMWDENCKVEDMKECSADGCVLDDPGIVRASFLVVGVFSLCQAFPEDADCSNGLIVSAWNEELTGDEIELLPDNQTAQIVNPRVQVTSVIGVLRWNATNLAERYGARCTKTSKVCAGLSCPLTQNSSQVLLLDKQRLQRNFSTDTTELVRLGHKLVLSSRLKQDNWDAEYFKGNHCSPMVEIATTHATQNHYHQRRDTLEYVSYLAAMLYLFDEARVYDVIPVSTNSSNTTLKFDGNIHHAHIGATIPKQAAVVSIVATTILLCLSLYVVVVAVLAEGEDEDTPPNVAASVHGVAEVMYDGLKYPKRFLSAQLVARDDILGDQREKRLQSLDDFHIEGATLRLRDDSLTSEPSTSRWEIVGTQTRLPRPTADSADDLDTGASLSETLQPAIA